MKFILLILSIAYLMGCASTDPQKIKPEPFIDSVFAKEAPRPIFDPRGSDYGRIEGLLSVHFSSQSTELSSQAQAQITTNALWLERHPDYNLILEGFGDPQSTYDEAIHLSQIRIESVKTHFMKLGVSPHRLASISNDEPPTNVGHVNFIPKHQPKDDE